MRRIVGSRCFPQAIAWMANPIQVSQPRYCSTQSGIEGSQATSPGLLHCAEQLIGLEEGRPELSAVEAAWLEAEDSLMSATAPDLSTGTLMVVLPVMSRVARHRLVGRKTTFQQDLVKSGDTADGMHVVDSSPYVSDPVRQVLGDWIAQCVPELSPVELAELLTCCVTLHVGTAETMSSIARLLCTKEAVTALGQGRGPLATAVAAVDVLHNVSLLVHRLRIKCPILDPVVAPLHHAQVSLSPAKTLRVFGALVRLRDKRFGETANLLSRRFVQDEAAVRQLRMQDIIFAMEASVKLPTVSEAFVVEVIRRLPGAMASARVPPRQLAAVAKNLVFLRSKKHTEGALRGVCSKDVRQTLDLLVEGAKACEGQFSLRDARRVLECLVAFDVRHSVLVAKLTSKAAGSDSLKLRHIPTGRNKSSRRSFL